MMEDSEEKRTDLYTDTVFSWSLEDISNEDLYKDKVTKIPESFESVQTYMRSYVNPLLEETRAQLFSSMEILYRAPFAEVVSFPQTRPFEKKAYQVTVDYWRNRFSDRSKDPYKTLPGDLLLLTNAKPETFYDLDRDGRSWAFLSVTNITEEFIKIGEEDEAEDNVFDGSTYFKVIASNYSEAKFGTESSLFVVYLMNLTSQKRIWKALHMSRNSKIVSDVLCIDSTVVNQSCDSCSQVNENFGMISTSGLNESQSKAVRSCLHSLHCKNKPSVEIIWGPPGTGKTKTAASLLVALIKMKVRTLICAPTNVAIVEVASRVMKMVADAEAEASFCSFGDILLFGNKERIKVGLEMQQIFLDNRVKKLYECFGPIGLSSSIKAMITLLEDCVPQYRIFVENELIKQKEVSDNKKITDDESEKSLNLKSFIVYVRERFIANVAQLRKCISIFYTHVPKNYILEHNFQTMMYLTELLDCLESLLIRKDVVSAQLEDLFSPSEVSDDLAGSFVDKNCLLSVKRACLSSLQSLHCWLKQLELPSFRYEEKIKLFCFERASLVFCTVSTSYKLHRMGISPMNVVLIDEAAQLKECESTIPLQLPGVKLAILVGDECQLPPTVISQICVEACFGRSLFERLSSQNHPRHLLNTQYRMHPSISFFPNCKFYHNQIQDALVVQRKSYEKCYLPGSVFGSYSFLNVIGGREEKDDDGHSRRNMVEVAIALRILHSLYKAWLESHSELSIGIISPYAAQVVAIQDKLKKKYDNIEGFRVKVRTVDGFQGGEDDIIILTTVRSGNGRSLEFISSPQRVNVALTRARHCLWILGNERTLIGSDTIWGDLVVDAQNRGCFFNADDDKDLAKTIIDVKKELDQFDDLLNSDSPLFKNATWKVMFSDNFLKSFKKLTSARMKKSVLNLLLKLSGGWRPKRPVLASDSESSMEIMKFKVEGMYVIGTVDIQKLSKYIQVLKIWDVMSLEDIPKLIKRLNGIFATYTDKFISLCNEKYRDGNLEIPTSWPPTMDIIQIKDISVNEPESDVVGEGRSYVENSRVSESLLLMKFYSLSFGVVSHLLSDRDGRELDLPFEVTDQEMEIILVPRSSFILGRSGTGKTTVLTMKLFQKEQLHHKAMVELRGDEVENQKSSSEEDKGTVLRQLFVTVSPKLCNAVKKHVSDLKSFACEGNASDGGVSTEMDPIDDEEEQFKNIPDSFIDISPNSYPLVVTFHKFLMMLDGSLSNSYFERFLDESAAANNRRQGSRSVALQTFLSTKEVNYDKFSVSYWPHFNSKLTKKLDSSRVFTEIISRIKGGPQALDSNDFRLGREDYVRLSEGRSSSLSGVKREAIFDIFLMYEKMKMERGEFDLADFVIDLHCRLEREIYRGDRMDFVYIDEVQDLTMSQIALFKHICNNVEEGFVFSGDTAQTIARGIDFRFQEIRTLFYQRFLLGSNEDRTEKGKLGKLFSLSQNFRTHAGILKLSQSIVELLYHFFPNSIDVLKPETSLIYGEPPLLLQSGNDENAIIKIFGNNNTKGSGKFVGFGAEQVILVRDDSARREIADIVGKQALLLTILECKGLEFQDVLLYNFFGSSPLKNQWRVIYEYMKEMDMFDSTPPPNCPEFSESKHNIMCSELKQLYVAVTRTRQRLWICENTDQCEPIYDFWKKNCLVQVRQLDDSLAQAMQVTSSAEEWRARGIKLFYEKNYEWATVCFERAGDKYWERMSKASGLKAVADHMRTSKPEEANSILREAAEIFETIGKADFAARCFADLGEYERAGRIYLDKFGESELARAAECFCLAGCYELAADVYARGSFFSECLNVCAKGKLFERGLEFVNDWKDQPETRGKELEKIEREFLERCALHYHEIKDKRSMMKFVRAFNSMDSIRSFLRPLGCFEELMSLEEESGNFVEAADIAKLRGDILPLIELLGKARRFKEASSLILSYVLAKSLWSPGKGWPLENFKGKDELLTKAKNFAKDESDTFHEFVCVEAEIMLKEGGDLPAIMSNMVSSQEHKSIRGEILSIWKLLDAHLSTKPDAYVRENELVSVPKSYSKDMMFKNQVSVESLFHFWDSWNGHIASVFEYLRGIVTTDANEYKNHGDFCFNFLGVWRQFQDLNPVYLLLCSEADWSRDVTKRSFWNNGKVASIDVHNLTSSARAYWCSEVLSIGIKVLEKLKSIYLNSVVLFCRSRTLCFIYLVADHLLESKHLKRSHRTSESLRSFVRLAVDGFVGCVFTSDWRNSQTSSSMVHLRGTGVAKTLLTQSILKHAGSKEISYGQIGNIAMIVMGSGLINNEVYAKIAKGLAWNPPWEAFLGNLCRVRVLINPKEIASADAEYPKVIDPHLFQRLIAALSDALNENWWRVYDYISPHCFFYLIESLICFAASSRGRIVTTKSSFVEWLVYQEEYSETQRSSSTIVPDLGNLPDEVRSFVIHVLKLWLYNTAELIKWIRKSRMNVNEQYPRLVTRMVVIMCLLQANFGKCAGLLFSFLGNQEIAKQLPREFRNTLMRGKGRQYPYLDVLSEALHQIGNPLVVARLGEKNTTAAAVSYPHMVLLDLKSGLSKNDILKTLFPHESPETVPSGCDQNSSDLKGNESFWDIVEAIRSLKDGSEHGKSLTVKLTENLENYIPLLSVGEDKKIFKTPKEAKEFDDTVGELKQLHAALVKSGSDELVEFEGVKEACKRVESRRATVEAVLNRFLGQPGIHIAEAEAVAEAEADNVLCGGGEVSETVKEASSEAVAQASDAKAKGKGKGKPGNKPQPKGKKKKGRNNK